MYFEQNLGDTPVLAGSFTHSLSSSSTMKLKSFTCYTLSPQQLKKICIALPYKVPNELSKVHAMASKIQFVPVATMPIVALAILMLQTVPLAAQMKMEPMLGSRKLLQAVATSSKDSEEPSVAPPAVSTASDSNASLAVFRLPPLPRLPPFPKVSLPPFPRLPPFPKISIPQLPPASSFPLPQINFEFPPIPFFTPPSPPSPPPTDHQTP
eukprot:Gb_39810 [translate_table: standard]